MRCTGSPAMVTARVRAQSVVPATFVAEVAQQPPAARRPAGAGVERQHEGLRVDPGAPERFGQLSRLGQRMTAASGVADLAGQVASRVEMDGAGDVPREVIVAWAAIDEEHPHPAPHGCNS